MVGKGRQGIGKDADIDQDVSGCEHPSRFGQMVNLHVSHRGHGDDGHISIKPNNLRSGYIPGAPAILNG